METVVAEIESTLRAMEGVNDVRNDMDFGHHQIKYTLTDEGRALGITANALGQQIYQAYFGEEVDRIQRGEDEVKVLVRYPSSQRSDITVLQNARIRTPAGDLVPLSTISTIEREFTTRQLQRVNGRYAITITADIDKTVSAPSAVMHNIQSKMLNQIQRDDSSIEFIQAGEAAEENETLNSLMIICLISISLIYSLLAIPLKSYTQPLIIFVAIPFGISGAIVGHWLSGLPISILSLTGMLALSGVVINDSLLLVNKFNVVKKRGGECNAALEAGSQRLRAVLITSITTFAGLSSLLWESSEQAQYLIPAVTSLAYGLLFATPITLIFIPILLSIFNKNKI